MNQGIDPGIHTAAIAGLELAVNRALALDPAVGAALEELDGYTFAIECTAPPVRAYVIPEQGRLRLAGFFEGPVTTSVTGSAADFAELAAADDPAATLVNGSLQIEGDSAPLIKLQGILARLDMDWEAPLVSVLGDVAGHQLAEILRGLFNWGQQIRQSLLRQVEEYIHEEARLSPPALELEDFYREVQSLGLQVERLESRAERLRRRLAGLKD